MTTDAVMNCRATLAAIRLQRLRRTKRLCLFLIQRRPRRCSLLT